MQRAQLRACRPGVPPGARRVLWCIAGCATLSYLLAFPLACMELYLRCPCVGVLPPPYTLQGMDTWKKKLGTRRGRGGVGPTVGVADGDCRSGGRPPRRWVDRQPSFDPARAAVHSAQRSEVRGSDSWRVLANPKSAHRFGPDVRSPRVLRTCAQQR